MNPIIFSQAMGKLGSLTLEKEKSEFKLLKFHLEIYLVSYSACKGRVG